MSGQLVGVNGEMLLACVNPGALIRCHREDRLDRPLVGQIIAGTLPGVILGAVIRVAVAIATAYLIQTVA